MNIENQLREDYIHDFHTFLRKNEMATKQKVKATLIPSPWQPNHPFRLVWDIISMLFIVIQMMIIPLILSFEIVDERTSLFMEIMDDFFLADILIQFNCAIYIDGKLILKRSSIICNYLKFWFWLDLISSLPYDYFVEGGNVQVIRMLRFFKFLKVIKMIKAFKLKLLIRRLETFLGNDFSSFMEFIKLTFIIVVLAHWSACIFNLTNQDDYDYLTSFYFTITTMITVGYGDVHPQTAEEQIYAIFAMILASGVFGYAANSMISIFQYQDPQLSELIMKQQIINKYTKAHGCASHLRLKIQNYLEWVVENDYEVRSSLIICDLSEELRNQVITQMNLRFFKTLPVTMTRAIKLNEYILPPETKIDDQHHIYYIIQGKVAVMANNIHLGYVEQCFGIVNFFSNIERTAELVTTETTNLVKLSRQQFLQQLNYEQFQKFHMIKQRLENNDYLDLDIKCFGCKRKGHVIKLRRPKTKFLRTRNQKQRTIYNQFLIEYYQMMQARKIKSQKIVFQKEEIQQPMNQNVDIDQIKNYIHFDPEWNINEVLQEYRLRTIYRYCQVLIKKNLKFLIRQSHQKCNNVKRFRLKTEIKPKYIDKYKDEKMQHKIMD
ncbi:unnamed protein product (macronuclear) [Paramecium tetraurelia]|uniref:Cyclic nucleotide-binding domain-containing protein n=1 Tax=Paramecium tetraurelia TaxID=5888 RepID=A0E814_PARTE|nr:uncharacterized protein GSPATT00024159001 [Paramecium tetraurelia]CAK91431.1 unnamed protein product [Paramecium tetraurelia]|eukprot:XP_001458828.1 hypothetical protein (macronuclear) [Paramecium tetraurelia strain d4-2]